MFFIKDRGHVVGRAVDSIQAIHQYAARVINAIFNSRYIWILEFNRSIYRIKGNPSSFELHGFQHGGCFFIFGEFIGLPVRIDIDLYDQAKSHVHAERKTISGQIEFWAMIGKVALDNPDLPIDFVRDLMIAKG